MRIQIILAGMLASVACAPSAEEPKAPEGPANSNEANAAPTKVKTSGKEPTALQSVPAEVLAAARIAQPTMTIEAAEAELRDGRNYYDVAGKLPDGSEIELDLLKQPSGWTVVETQRDIGFGSAPEPVRAASASADPGFKPVRVIESRQNDGIVIYELFGPAPAGGEGRKVEIKYDGRKAELLTREWAH